MTNQKTHCGRCGKDCRYNPELWPEFVSVGELTELSAPYSIYGVKSLCKECGDKANSFLNYYGKKKKSDRIKLAEFIKSGIVSAKLTKNAYTSLMNGGYYD